jgi:mannose-1-phosphate guanylyltransferase
MSSSPGDAGVWAVVLAGGIGSRFWPVSTPARPKQVLPLSGTGGTLIGDTVARIRPLVGGDRLRILAGARLGSVLAAVVPELGHSLWVEPLPKGTAPVLAWAAHRIAAADPEAVMLSLHSDHVVAPESAFRSLLQAVASTARSHDRLFTIGVEPQRPETGYGYIQLGAALTREPDTFSVRRFVEKPALDTARGYLAEGGYLWNSGIFVWRVAVFLDEVRRHTPELASLLPLLDAGRDDAFFQQAPVLSVDQAVLERSDCVAVARATFRWDDVGTWEAVARTRAPDAGGNVARGDAHLVDTTGCVAWSDEGPLVLFGVSDLVVVRANGITLVTRLDRSADLKTLLSQLPESLRDIEPADGGDPR